jgi:hypothetical protein
LDLVKVGISLEYGHEWTTEHEFDSKVPIEIAPQCRGNVFAVTPGIRDYGDFTVTLGNTVWKLHDVYFDSPDPNGTEGYKLTEEPLNQRGGDCPALPGGPRRGAAMP